MSQHQLHAGLKRRCDKTIDFSGRFGVDAAHRSPLLTNAGGAVCRQLEALVTVAHEGAVGVEAAVSAHVVVALIHICRHAGSRVGRVREEGKSRH